MLDVTSLTASSDKLRATTSLTFVFSVPNDDVMTGSNYACVDLPNYWGNSPTMVDQSASLSATLAQTVVGEAEAVTFNAPTVMYSVGSIAVLLDITTTTTEPTILISNEYTLVVKNIPTPEQPAAAPGSFVLSIGTQALGGKGWSSAQFFKFAQPTFTTETGKTLL
jgi:hypothetical protein